MTSDTHLTDGLLTWLDAVESSWAASGISRVERHRLGRELERSIVEGLESGATEADFLRDEPADVATDIAAANGHTPPTSVRGGPTRRSFVRTSVIGAGAGVVCAWVLLLWLPYLAPMDTPATWVVLYACVAACPFLIVALAIRRAFPAEPRLRRLQAVAVIGVFTGALAAVVPCVALARALNYPSMNPLVLPELALGLAICAGAVDVAWRLGWKDQQQ